MVFNIATSDFHFTILKDYLNDETDPFDVVQMFHHCKYISSPCCVDDDDNDEHSCWAHADYEHSRSGQVCGMLSVSDDNLSSMIYLSSNGLSGPKWT